FVVWVLSRIIRVLAEPGCSPLHSKAISAVLSITQLIKSKDLVFYQRILSEFVVLLRDLVVIEETIFGDTDVPDSVLPLCLDHFQFFDLKDVLEKSGLGSSEQSKVTKKQICIKTEEDCSLIHEGISQIMCQVVGDVCHYANGQVNLLWRTCCVQIQTGVSIIKQFGLKIASDLLSHGGLPQLPVLDQFIKSLCAVMDIVGSGVCHSLPSDVIIPLEKSLATCLEKLFLETSASSSGKTSDSHWSTAAPLIPAFILPSWHINHVCTQLSKTMESGGLGKLLTVELKSCICDLTNYIYNHVPGDCCRSAGTSSLFKHTINKALLQHVGMETEQQITSQ
ncbi:hypothetical protein QZH41_012154, partial [Actinostola sp. cb2023]